MAFQDEIEGSEVISGRFYSREKKFWVTLTTACICWKAERGQENATVIPLSQLFAVTPCDCSNQSLKSSKCYHCSFSHYKHPQSFSEFSSFRTKALRFHFAVPFGKHSWKLENEVFYPAESTIVKEWVCSIHDVLSELNRPKKLLVFINPNSGKRKGVKIYENKVSPIFHLAGIDAHVIVTQKANHAEEVIQEINVYKFDGIVCVGGDGIFSEVLNGLLLKTQKDKSIDINDVYSNLITPRLPLGIIPTGSTNATAYCITGSDDPVSAAILIVMGDCVGIDVCGVHHQRQFLRFAITFLSYGFFGDVITDSDKFRWMGPKRYDYSGMRKILSRNLYDGELQLKVSSTCNRTTWEHERCRIGCTVCTKASEKIKNSDLITNNSLEKSRWLTVRGKFIAVNAAVMSCACSKSPDGMSPSQHIGNGYCDIIIVSSSSRLNYLKYLLRTAYHHKNPFDLDFVQVYRVREFMFSPYVTDDKTPETGCTGVQENRQELHYSVWNCDGEVITEPLIYSKVHCQLVNVFGRGFEEREVESSYLPCFGFCKKKHG